MGMHYNTSLSIEHFSDPSFAAEMREVFPHIAAQNADFPIGHEIAKAWEVTMAIRAFRRFGVLRSNAEMLGVGAGSELTLYYLTRHVRRVFATDRFADSGVWSDTAQGSMLVAPERFAPPGYDWEPRRLVVQHMDACDLHYDDNSFDGVFSCGSIEHFGSLESVAKAAHEMGRVLKPNGILAISTEFRLEGPPTDGIPGAIIFTPEMLERSVIKPSGLLPVDDASFATSARTFDLAYPLLEAIQKGIRIPSVALTHEGFRWTSVSIVLRKPA